MLSYPLRKKFDINKKNETEELPLFFEVATVYH